MEQCHSHIINGLEVVSSTVRTSQPSLEPAPTLTSEIHKRKRGPKRWHQKIKVIVPYCDPDLATSRPLIDLIDSPNQSPLRPDESDIEFNNEVIVASEGGEGLEEEDDNLEQFTSNDLTRIKPSNGNFTTLAVGQGDEADDAGDTSPTEAEGHHQEVISNHLTPQPPDINHHNNESIMLSADHDDETDAGDEFTCEVDKYEEGKSTRGPNNESTVFSAAQYDETDGVSETEEVIQWASQPRARYNVSGSKKTRSRRKKGKGKQHFFTHRKSHKQAKETPVTQLAVDDAEPMAQVVPRRRGRPPRMAQLQDKRITKK
jgi:hypothetical protein